jgi:hypothetical protein
MARHQGASSGDECGTSSGPGRGDAPTTFTFVVAAGAVRAVRLPTGGAERTLKKIREPSPLVGEIVRSSPIRAARRLRHRVPDARMRPCLSTPTRRPTLRTRHGEAAGGLPGPSTAAPCYPTALETRSSVS